MPIAMKGTPRYAARAQKRARDGSRVRYMNVNAVSHNVHATASAPNASVTRETRRRSTLAPKTIISAAVTAVEIADGGTPVCRRSMAMLDRQRLSGRAATFVEARHFRLRGDVAEIERLISVQNLFPDRDRPIGLAVHVVPVPNAVEDRHAFGAVGVLAHELLRRNLPFVHQPQLVMSDAVGNVDVDADRLEHALRVFRSAETAKRHPDPVRSRHEEVGRLRKREAAAIRG